MDQVKKPVCTDPGCPAVRMERVAQIRRGERVIEVTRAYWRCERCQDPVEGGPLEFVDPPLALENDATARAAWAARFGEPLPRRQPPGRKPEVEPRHRVTVVFTESELRQLDSVRGSRPRSEFIRRTVLAGKAGTRR